MGNSISVNLSELDNGGALSVPLEELETSKPKPSKIPVPRVSFDSVYGQPSALARADNPFGVSTAPPPVKPSLAVAAGRSVQPQINLAPPENPQPQSPYWAQEYAARQRDIEKINQTQRSNQERDQQQQEHQAEIAKQPFENRLLQSFVEPGTAIGSVISQQSPQEAAPQYESDYFKHRAAEATTQGKSVWDAFPHSITEALVRSQNPNMRPEQARQLAEPFTQPLLDVPTAAGHTDQPFVAGAERAAGGLTSPESLALLGTLGELDAAAQSSTGLLREAPRVVSGLFATQMGAGLVQSAREYQAAKAAGDAQATQRILGSALVQAPLALLTAYHASAGRAGAPMRADELVDHVLAADTAAKMSGAGSTETPASTTPNATPALPRTVSVPLDELKPARPARGAGTSRNSAPLFPELDQQTPTAPAAARASSSADVLRRTVADESLPPSVRDAANAELERLNTPRAPGAGPAQRFEVTPPETRTIGKAEASPQQRQQSQAYVNRIRDIYTREYAQSYLKANLEGGAEPDRGNISPLSAASIRRAVDDNLARQPSVPVAQKYPADVLEEAQTELRAARDLASSFERPGRYHPDLGPEYGAKEQDKAWYGVGSSRNMVADQFPWYSDEAVTPGKLADAAARGKGANYERIVGRIADHITAQREEAKPIIEEFAPRLESLAAQVRDVDPELSQTLLDIRRGRYASLRNLPAFIEGKVTDAQRAAQFSQAFDELAGAEAGDALPEVSPQGAEPDRGARENSSGEEAPRGQLAPLEVPLSRLTSNATPIEPQVELPERGREFGESISPDELDSGAWSLFGVENYSDLSERQKTAVIGALSKTSVGSSIATPEGRGDVESAGVLPGFGEAVREQAAGAGRVRAEELTREINSPRSIDRAAGELETKSPLFRGTGASPQNEMFASRGQAALGPERDYEDVGKHLGVEYRGVMGADMGLGDKAVVIYQDPASGTSIGVKVGEWSPERVQEKLQDARDRMAGDPTGGTLYGGLGFLDPELIRRVMPESLKNALGENISLREREAGIVREKTGELARKKEQVFQQYADAMARWEKRPVQAGRDFILREQHGEKQPNTQDQAVADQLQKEFASRRQAIEDLTHGSFDHWREHYFPQFWERPNQVADWVKQRIMGGKRPLQGPAGFRKARVFDDLQEGLDAGFKPLTNNPVSMALLKLHEMDRYVMAHQILGQSLQEGLAKFVKFGEQPPNGWARVNDSMFRVLQRSEEAQGFVIRGEYFMPTEAGRILNNYLAPGLRGNPLYDVFRGAGNTLNQAQLGFSAFHAMFSALNSSISDFALALRKVSRLNLAEAAGAALRSATLVASPVRHVVEGSKLMREYLSPGTYAKYSELADAVATSGGRIYQDPLYRNASIGKFFKAWSEGDWKRVGLQAVPATLEKMAQPVMEKLVPRLKVGAFSDVAREALDRLPPGAGKAEIRAALDRAWDSVDNRFGQVVYDNLFMNKSVKDLGLISVRSLGWNLGTVRELGGAGKDLAKAAGRAITGEKPRFTDRIAYTMALPIVTGYIGALVNYAYTGQGPQELKDYFFSRTGRTLPNGEPERISIPTYMKDVYAFAKHPLVTASHKVHPLLSMVSDMVQNKDFYDTEIRHPDDPLVTQATQLTGYVAEQLSPLSYRNLAQRAKAEGRPGVKGTLREAVSPAGLESFVGITPAPSSVTHTNAEEKAIEILNRRAPQGTRTSEEFNRGLQHSYLRGEVAAGRMKPEDLAKRVRAGELSPKEAGDVLKQAREAAIVHYTRTLPLEDFLQVWDLANQREREQLRPLLIVKRHLVANLPANERASTAQRVNDALRQTAVQ